jgi:hypothetical protein
MRITHGRPIVSPSWFDSRLNGTRHDPIHAKCELLFNCVPAANSLDSRWGRSSESATEPGAERQLAQFFDQGARWGVTTVQDMANDLLLEFS